MTLLAIDTYCGIYDFLPLMWPHYERAGLPIIGITRTNARKPWVMPFPHLMYGDDLFTRYTNHFHPTLLPERLCGMIESLLKTDYSNFVLSSWNAVFTKPLPEQLPSLGLHTAGGAMRDKGFTAPYFFHLPIIFDRETGQKIASMGRALIERGQTEKGSEDVFLGLIVSRLGLKWQEIPAYVRNNIEEEPHYMEEARREWKCKNAWWIKGVKTPQQLERLLA